MAWGGKNPGRWIDRVKKKESYRNENRSYTGTSGQGKTTGAIEDHRDEIGEKFILVGDPVGHIGPALLEHMWGWYDNVLVDDLSCRDRVLSIEPLHVSEDPDPDEQDDQNKLARENTIEFLLRNQNTDNQNQPVKYETLDMGLQLYQTLPKEIRAKYPVSRLADIYCPWTNGHHYLCDVCPSEDLVTRFKRTRTLHESTRMSTYGSAERVLKRTFGNPAVRRRASITGAHIEHLVRNKYVIIIMGGNGVSAHGYRTVVEYWTTS